MLMEHHGNKVVLCCACSFPEAYNAKRKHNIGVSVNVYPSLDEIAATPLTLTGRHSLASCLGF